MPPDVAQMEGLVLRQVLRLEEHAVEVPIADDRARPVVAVHDVSLVGVFPNHLGLHWHSLSFFQRRIRPQTRPNPEAELAVSRQQHRHEPRRHLGFRREPPRRDGAERGVEPEPSARP